MSAAERRTRCLACEGWGCERCKGGPGEQGLTYDEKQLFEARDQLRVLRSAVRKLNLGEAVHLEWATLSAAERAAIDEARR